MILVAAALVGVLTVPLTGGRLSLLATIPLRHVWTVWASIAIQLSITVGGAPVSADVAEVLHLISTRVGVVHLVEPAPGRHVAGGRRRRAEPAGDRGQRRHDAGDGVGVADSGLDVAAAGQFENSGISSGSPLWFVGDVFAVPQGWPFANVFSPGDVIIVVGLLVLVHTTCRPRPSGSDGRRRDRRDVEAAEMFGGITRIDHPAQAGDDKIGECADCIPTRPSTSPRPRPTTSPRPRPADRPWLGLCMVASVDGSTVVDHRSRGAVERGRPRGAADPCDRSPM